MKRNEVSCWEGDTGGKILMVIGIIVQMMKSLMVMISFVVSF